MDIAAALGDLVSAKQKEVDVLNEVIAELAKPADQAPVGDADALAKLQAEIDAVVKERDALRDAIKVEVDDKKADTARLEKAIAPVEVAPVPEVPAPVEAPVEAAPAPEAPAEAPAEEAPAAPAIQTLE